MSFYLQYHISDVHEQTTYTESFSDAEFILSNKCGNFSFLHKANTDRIMYTFVENGKNKEVIL